MKTTTIVFLIVITLVDCSKTNDIHWDCGCEGVSVNKLTNAKGKVVLLDAQHLYGIQIDSIGSDYRLIPCDTILFNQPYKISGLEVIISGSQKYDCSFPYSPSASWMRYGHMMDLTKIKKQ